MNPTGSSEIQHILAELLADRPYSHKQDVDPAIAAVITVEDDLRFFPDTMRAVFAQTVLPGTIVVADCGTGRAQPVTASFDVIPSPSGPLRAVPETKTVDIRVIPVHGAVSFGDAATKAMAKAGLPDTVRAWWMLHDDSRPADDCLARLTDTWRNNPTASLLGAKQLDWGGDNLHDVGLYAGRHRLESLVVDGEEDQEQYDSRQDVFAVSLAGALLPTQTLHAIEGINGWFTTYGESADLCRRICLDGGRVVVVPTARIAHRRARYEGIRTRNGQPVDDNDHIHSTMAVISAGQRYLYTDIRMLWWPLLWLARLIHAIGAALAHLLSKRPWRAACELCLPWKAIISLPRAAAARRLVARHSTTPMNRLTALSVNRQQLGQWKDRAQALEDQHNTILLSPLARTHLHQRLIRRWTLAAGMALIAFLTIAISHHDTLTAALTHGASLYSDQLPPTSATFGQLAQAATTPWAFATGTPAPPAPWLLIWLAASTITLGHPAAALTLIYFTAAPLAALSFWALAGIFTRSNGIRVAAGLLWAALAMGAGLFATADLPMLTVMVFMPAAFAFAFRAVGMYRTEDQLKPHQSVQSAAFASLCFIPVIAAEPQLLLPLIASFVVFLIFVRGHRIMLLLMPVPAAFVTAPTLVNAVKYASEGAWRQIFADMTTPTVTADGRPAALTLAGALGRVFAPAATDGLNGMIHDPAALAAATVLTALAILSIASLALPFALRASRLMWTTTLTGGLLALCATRIAIASDTNTDVAASATPGIMMMMLGMLSCACLVAGAAVKRFTPLRQPTGTDTTNDTAEPTTPHTARHHAARIARAALAILLVACAAATGWASLSDGNRDSVAVSRSGLPMVASDYLAQGADHRILALHATSSTSVEYTVMRSSRGDLIDSSPAQRLQLTLTANTTGTTDDDTSDMDAILARSAAKLLAGADAQSINDISRLGFGGLFVTIDTDDDTDSAAQRLISNVTATEGTQSVVSATNGTYYRLTINSADNQNIDTTRQRLAQHSQWRRAWLICAGTITALYCLVALPHRTYRYTGEES
ncbi:glycosyltransferase family 2 protein [Bifidobacterium aerophilum]|uniref:Glycosyltransferase family 2 protein n=1 Tax=Bifidobacterium aerophilum TaxID=1798155 RepID=A0A6N9Z3Z4_9BIFI|nr:glycosyltransferase family 2 protein [Bifidobacterium aerophilum]NEG89379.1 glycosyltransferase family 2 protein [Bifidobacterium aerophilum]